MYGHLGPAERAAPSTTFLAPHANTLFAAVRDPKKQMYRVRVGLIRKVVSRLEEAYVRRLLEHPLSVGSLQRTILDALGEPKQCFYRNTWNYLDRIK
jgi:hypothetical protein